jgi:hypothetical protein
MPAEYEMRAPRSRNNAGTNAKSNGQEEATSPGSRDQKTLATLGKKQALKVSIHGLFWQENS